LRLFFATSYRAHMAFNEIDQTQVWNGVGAMQGMNPWAQQAEMSSTWGASMPPLDQNGQVGQAWPTPLLLAEQVQRVSDQAQAMAMHMQWGMNQATSSPPYWYPSTDKSAELLKNYSAGNDMTRWYEQAQPTQAPAATLLTIPAPPPSAPSTLKDKDLVKAVSKLLEGKQANKKKWTMFCVANGIQVSLKLEEYETALLERFINFCKTDLSLAAGELEEEREAKMEEGEGAGAESSEKGDNVLTDKIHDAVAKFLQDGEEGESEAEDDDIDEAVQSFMGQAPLVPTSAPVPAPAPVPPPPYLPPQMDKLKESSAAAPAGPPGIFQPQEPAQMPAGFTLLQNDFSFPQAGQAEVPMSSFAGGQGPLPTSQLPPFSTPTTGAHRASSIPLPGAVGSTAAKGGPNKTLAQCMRQLFSDGAIPHDVQITVDDGMMKAHRFCLATRCLFFESKLQGCGNADPGQRQPLTELRLPGLTLDVLKHILLYIYTDKIDYSLEDPVSLQPREIEYCVHLCEIADYLGLPGLTKLLTNEVLLPVAQAIQEFNLIRDRQQRDQRALQTVAALSAAVYARQL